MIQERLLHSYMGMPHWRCLTKVPADRLIEEFLELTDQQLAVIVVDDVSYSDIANRTYCLEARPLKS